DRALDVVQLERLDDAFHLLHPEVLLSRGYKKSALLPYEESERLCSPFHFMDFEFCDQFCSIRTKKIWG
ncbi:MAG: hypothetical protein JW773_11435, partial [Desulfuromonadales bacterium]|nr:hypothetical protein [Desulfuromonadales bacterium]